MGSIYEQINTIYANEDEDMKTTIWSNVAVSEELAELCLQDHQKLGQRRNEIQRMVDMIGELAATLGNEKSVKVGPKEPLQG